MTFSDKLRTNLDAINKIVASVVSQYKFAAETHQNIATMKKAGNRLRLEMLANALSNLAKCFIVSPSMYGCHDCAPFIPMHTERISSSARIGSQARIIYKRMITSKSVTECHCKIFFLFDWKKQFYCFLHI